MTILFLKKWLMPAGVLVSAGLLWMGIQVFRVFYVPVAEPVAGPGPDLRGGERVSLPSLDVFSRPGEEDLDRRAASLMLSGTIQLEGGTREDGGVDFVALVDDGETGRQHLVAVGEALGPFRVKEIGREYLTISKDDRNWQLEMTGAVRVWAGRGGSSRRNGEEGAMTWEDMPALETTPFGKRVAHNQWVIQREAVHAYVRDLIEDPARAVKLYDSFREAPPVGEDGLAGFSIQKRGEHDFFRAMGLEDGMVIRAVNSMEMRSQARAEFMVRAFMRGELGAVILDIDQPDGEIGKNIYIIR
ncbi:MAG: hypothetical protein JJU05_12850 [Verrucomicrobia bacterium]|nr:hypothetical protein [Verrucomicrobiota bacterium]MCH8528457.1 hypothetical protein [Kiritimatiellia bacterium]